MGGKWSMQSSLAAPKWDLGQVSRTLIPTLLKNMDMVDSIKTQQLIEPINKYSSILCTDQTKKYSSSLFCFIDKESW